MKVCHQTNLTRLYLIMFFIMYKTQILVKIISVNNGKVHLLNLKRNGESINLYNGVALDRLLVSDNMPKVEAI